ncbi:MAG: hypothetical protein ACEPOZ_01065 [Marinifilaceae bacterium]|jgi:hypothetical protein
MENLRIYRIKDIDLVFAAERMAKSFENHLPGMESCLPQMNQDYLNKFKGLLKQLEKATSGKVYTNIQAHQTQIAGDCRKQAILFYKKLMFYVEQAFPNNKLMWEQFGTTSLHQARQSDERMSWFLKITAHACKLFRKELLEVNCPESLLNKAEELASEMEEKTFEKICMIKERQRHTIIRIEIMNSIWNMMLQIHRTAEIIFEEQPLLLKEFELPNRKIRQKI